MPKYLIAASYSGEGLQGSRKDKSSVRRQAIATAIEGLGGKLECEYFARGEHDVYLIADLPGNICAAALGIASSATGLGAHAHDRADDRRRGRPRARKKRQLPRAGGR
jgi:uncharacterized protein with GYD domain